MQQKHNDSLVLGDYTLMKTSLIILYKSLIWYINLHYDSMWWTQSAYLCHHFTEPYTGVSFSISVWHARVRRQVLSLLTAHWSSDLRIPRESGEAHRLLYIIYNSLTNVQLGLMHSVNVHLLRGLSTRIIHISSFSFLNVVKHNKHWEHFRADLYLFIDERELAECQQESHVKKPGGETWAGERWGQQIAILQPELLSLSTLHFFPPEGRIISIHIHTRPVLMRGYCTDRDKEFCDTICAALPAS